MLEDTVLSPHFLRTITGASDQSDLPSRSPRSKFAVRNTLQFLRTFLNGKECTRGDLESELSGGCNILHSTLPQFELNSEGILQKLGNPIGPPRIDVSGIFPQISV